MVHRHPLCGRPQNHPVARDTVDDLARLAEEVSTLQARRARVEAEAADALQKRASGTRIEELERRGRWLRASEAGLRAMLEI